MLVSSYPYSLFLHLHHYWSSPLRLVDFSLPITLSLRVSLIFPKTLFWYSYPILMLALLILVSLACPYSPVDTSHGLYRSGLWHHHYQWKPSTTTYRCGIQWSVIYYFEGDDSPYLKKTNVLKTGPDRPVRSFGLDEDRMGVGPLEPAVQPVNRPIQLVLFFLKKNNIKTTSFWCFWHQNDAVLESYLRKRKSPSCAATTSKLQPFLLCSPPTHPSRDTKGPRQIPPTACNIHIGPADGPQHAHWYLPPSPPPAVDASLPRYQERSC